MSFFNFGRRPDVVTQVQATVAPNFSQVVTGELDKIVKTTRSNGHVIPVEAALILFRMTDDIRALNEHMQAAEPTRDEKIAVEFMTRDYIPSTLQAFLISRADANAKNADLIKQLGILRGKVDSMLESVYAHDSAQLEINGRFLAEKFGHASA